MTLVMIIAIVLAVLVMMFAAGDRPVRRHSPHDQDVALSFLVLTAWR
jgi:hypothetical protein